MRQATGPGTWAFASQPVDIAGPGDYTFRFGPLTAEFDYGKTVTSVAYVPPSDFAGQVTPLPKEDPSVVSDGGQRYFQLTMHVGGAVVPCTGLVMFIE